MNTLTLASIYESQGHKRDALEVYWKILESDPNNSAAMRAIERLSKIRREFKNPNPKKVKEFVSIKTDKEYRAFEEWLLS